MEILVSKKWLAQAAGLAKLTASTLSQHVDSLDHSLVRVTTDSIRLTSTNDSSGSDITVALSQEAPELLDDPLSFWVRPGPLYDLIHQEPGDEFKFTVDTKRSSISAVIGSAKLQLPIKTELDWPSIDARFIPEEGGRPLPTTMLKELLGFNRFFLSGGHDPSKNLVEFRSSMAISTDRIKFGFYVAPELDGLEIRLPGDQLAALESSMAYFPAQVSVSSSSAYTLLQGDIPGVKTTFGLVKTNYLLGQGLDSVPGFLEKERILVDRKLLLGALTKLSSVSVKVDARLKLTFSGAGSAAKLTLATANELSQESTDFISVNRAAGDSSIHASIIVPMAVFLKFLKMSPSENIQLSLETKNSKYLKVFENRGHAYTFGVFQALSGMRS